jgi:hypothetical protein
MRTRARRWAMATPVGSGWRGSRVDRVGPRPRDQSEGLLSEPEAGVAAFSGVPFEESGVPFEESGVLFEESEVSFEESEVSFEESESEVSDDGRRDFEDAPWSFL